MFKVYFPKIYPDHNRVFRMGFDNKRLLRRLQLLSVRGTKKPPRNAGLFICSELYYVIGTVQAESRKEGRSAAFKRHPAPGTNCLLYTSPSPRDRTRSRMPS